MDLETKLIDAAKLGYKQDIERILRRAEIGGKLDLNAGDPDGNTALHLLAGRGLITAVDLLLRAGAKANPVNKMGFTPSDIAYAEGHTKVVDLLSRYGAKHPKERNKAAQAMSDETSGAQNPSRNTGKEKPVMGVVSCFNCKRLLPGGLSECPHCRPSHQKLAIPKDLLQWMSEARDKADEGARHFIAGDLDKAIELSRKSIEMNPWNATAHGNLGHALMKKNVLEEAAECLERASYICPSIEGVREACFRVGQLLGRPVDSWRKYKFAASFKFDTDKHAIDSLQVLPNDLLNRMDNPELTYAPNGCFLGLSGEPLTKAEIWYITLAIDACGPMELAVGLPGMTTDEQERVFKRFMAGRLRGRKKE